MKKIVQVYRAGIITFQDGLNIQKYFTSTFNRSTDFSTFKNILILTEHKPVYTIGIRNKDYTDEDEQHLRKLGAEFYKTNRGGLITFHGPGQLVAYPILHLKQFKPSVRWYVNSLEESIIKTCCTLKLKAERTEHTGIWIDDKKICSIGIHASRYITTHGIALNCNTDLKWFEHIVPCGIIGKNVTSISKELNQNIDIDCVIPIFLNSFCKVFDCDISEMNIKVKLKTQIK